MNTSIEFLKTGNFWFDNGLVGLYRILFQNGDWLPVPDEVSKAITYKATLSVDRLSISLENPADLDVKDLKHEFHPHLFRILSAAKETVAQNYLTDTASAGWIYANNQFEVYRKKDFRMHLKAFFTGKTPQTEGALCTPFDKTEVEKILSRANIPFVKGKDNLKLTQKVKIDGKDEEKEWVIPVSKDAKVSGAKGRFMNDQEFITFLDFFQRNSPTIIEGKPVKLDGKGFLNTKPKHDFGAGFEAEFLLKGKKICAFSGEKVAKAEVVNGMNFPFLTGTAGEMNFSSNLKVKPLLSEKYAFISFFAFHNLNYLLQDTNSNYFILSDSDLKGLNSFYKSISASLDSLVNPTYCNFKNEMRNALYEYESLFGFVLSVFEQLGEKMASDARRKEAYGKTIFTFINDGNIFRNVREYTSLDQLFQLFEAFQNLENGGVFQNFKVLVGSFYRKISAEKYDYTWRNRLCEKVLNFQSPARVIELYMAEDRIEAGVGFAKLREILEVYYQLNFSDMKKEMIEKCNWYGQTIGKYAFLEKDKSALYSLRNAKNKGEFFKVLEQVQFRIADSQKMNDDHRLNIHPDFFTELPDTAQWEEYKSLMSIFAMNSYLYWKKQGSNQA